MKHSLKNLVTGSYGIPIIPDFVGVLLVDDIQTGYCDSSQKTFKIQHDWAEKILENDPQQKGYYNIKCFEDEPNKFRQLISSLKGESEGTVFFLYFIFDGYKYKVIEKMNHVKIFLNH